MKTKLLTAALLVSVALLAPALAGGGNHGGGGGGGGGSFAPGGGGFSRGGGGPSFHSGGMRSFGGGGGRMIYSGQRFSSVGMGAPRSMEFRPQSIRSNASRPIGSNQFARGNNINRVNRSNQFAGNRANTNLRRDGNGARQVRSGNNLPANWRNHVVAQHSGNWQRNWDRSRDHVWHGHHCRFINGSWVIFDFGFDRIMARTVTAIPMPTRRLRRRSSGSRGRVIIADKLMAFSDRERVPRLHNIKAIMVCM